jgi:hypothetical protein
MCIVPCGHSVCDECGDEGSLKKRKTRPFSAPPVCCEEMCELWVMDLGSVGGSRGDGTVVQCRVHDP